jgi:hypothetical protein
MLAVTREGRMAKTVYLSERGDDKNDGLVPERPVLSGKRAIQISLTEKTQVFDVTGSEAYVRRMNAELEKKQ